MASTSDNLGTQQPSVGLAWALDGAKTPTVSIRERILHRFVRHRRIAGIFCLDEFCAHSVL